MKFINNAQFILYLLPLIFFLGCSPKTEQPQYISIGALLPLTGKDADEGIRAYNGLLLAKEEINNNGGVLGKKLDIIVYNDKGDAQYIAEQYNKLKELNVAAIIGSSYSDVTMALVKAAEKDGIPIITPTASDNEITLGRRNVFRAIFTDDYQAEVLAHFAFNSLDAKTALVLVNQNNASFKRITQVFIESFSAYGGTSVTEYYSTENDFAPILKKYAANEPDLIFCPESYKPAAKLVNTAYESGFKKTRLLGSDGWDGYCVYINYPDAVKKAYFANHFSFDDKDEEAAAFVRNYFKNFLQLPLSAPASSYTCVYILSEAIKLAGSTNKDAVISAIKANEPEQITGTIKFDQNNNPHINVYIMRTEGRTCSTFKKICL